VQEVELERMREHWLLTLTQRQEYLDQHLQKIVCKPGTAVELNATPRIETVLFSQVFVVVILISATRGAPPLLNGTVYLQVSFHFSVHSTKHNVHTCCVSASHVTSRVFVLAGRENKK